MMEYKGYHGVMEVDDEAGVIFGRAIGLRDVITFQGETIAEARQAFHDSVDDYLEFCAERGESPEKPFSGKFVLRVSPALHRAMSHRAEAQGMSLNALVERALADQFFASLSEAAPKIDRPAPAKRQGKAHSTE